MDLDPIFQLPNPIRTSQLAGGANNRVFKLEFDDRDPLVYKQYFQHPNDPRPRLQTEFSFLEYAWKLGLRNIPQPLKASPTANAALYPFLTGRFVQSTDLNDSLIEQTTSFFLALNRDKSTGLHLRNSSESCFSFQDFLKITESRIDRLKTIQNKTSIERDVVSFFDQDLLPKWKKIKESTCKAALHPQLSLDSPLPQEARCISPSDFGFHNVLLHESGSLSFIDFEYAGWDDPCKTVCDFFCQPRVPVPEKYFPSVAEAFSSAASNPDACMQRIGIIWPVMQMKWCCILLNTFTQVGKNRRAFSQSEELDRQEKQLSQTKQLLNKIEI